MQTDLFRFQWRVDLDGYDTKVEPGIGLDRGHEVEVIRPSGRRWQNYRPLEFDGLWLRFAETCRTRDGVLQFVKEYGLLHDAQDPVHYIQRIAEKLWEISQYLESGDPRSAAARFVDEGRDPFALPMMFVLPLPSPERPDVFVPAVVPRQLEDALKWQALGALTGNRRFRRCRNEGCANWFGIGTRAPKGQTYTVRREFCSDRCRVAWARRNKREAAHA
jgi:hypothetical protein